MYIVNQFENSTTDDGFWGWERRGERAAPFMLLWYKFWGPASAHNT